MFTGIIETQAQLLNVQREQTNLNLTFGGKIAAELKIDQSVSHNGVCLTVVRIFEDSYVVTVVDETLKKTNLGTLDIGDFVNIERCTPLNGRFDGHIVQGHVDTIAICKAVEDLNGSWKFVFEHPQQHNFITVEKGSITVNGVSLTVVDSTDTSFSVHIIPYTFENTSFRYISKGSDVNLEFDIIGKYVAKLMDARK